MTLFVRSTIDDPPEPYLRSIGNVFAVFGAPTQDSGNVSYGVEVDGVRYFVKTAGVPDDAKPFVAFDDRVAALRNAVLFSSHIRHPTLPGLIHVIESPRGPLLVYEWRDGELLGVPAARRMDPHSSFNRFCALPPPAVERCLDAVFDLHKEISRAGWVAVDFYDGALIYDFAATRITVVDLDLYRDEPFRNDMGRMFGSTRFMAPEEFELGAWIDQRTNVFTMGRTAAVFLSEGTLDRKAFRGSDALFDVVRKACERAPERRFQTMAEFHSAWQAARSA